MQHAGQRITVALTAGKHADALKHVVFGKQETAQQAAQFGLRRARRDSAQIVQNFAVSVQFLVLILCKVIDGSHCGPA